MQVPKLEKIVINMGVSDVKESSKALEIAIRDREENNVRISALRDAFVKRVLNEIPFDNCPKARGEGARSVTVPFFPFSE